MAKRKSKHNLHIDTQLDYLFRKGINLRSRIITLSGDVEGSMFRLVDAALSEFEARSTRPIIIRINSMGGSVYDALAIAGRIKKSKCRVITEGYGAIMSAATLVLASGATRRISRTAWFMIHEASYTVGGKHSDVAAYVAQSEREETEWLKWMVKFTGTPEQLWRDALGKHDAYYSADQLKKLGVVDVII